MAKMIVAMASEILGILTQTTEDQREICLSYIAERRRTLSHLQQLISDMGISAPAEVLEAFETHETVGHVVDTREDIRRYDAAVEKLIDIVADRIWVEGSRLQYAAVSQLTQRLIHTTVVAQERLDELIRANLEAQIQSRSEARSLVTAESLQTYWRKRFPHSPDARVTSLRELAGGFSKTTLGTLASG